MRNLRIIVATALCLMLLTEAATAQSSAVGAQLPTNRLLGRYGLERAWWSQATMDASRERVRHVTVDEENVYVQSTGGVITAFEGETGQRLWARQLGRVNSTSFPAVSNDSTVLVVVGPTLYALDKPTGNLAWELRLPDAVSAPPGADDDHVYIGTLDGSVYALNLAKIKTLYSESLLPEWSFNAVQWRYQCGREVSTAPVPFGEYVSFTSRDGSLYTVTADRRDLVYQFETDGPISAPLARRGKNLYLASEDFAFYCIRGDNGQIIWEFISGLAIRKAPQVIDRHLYFSPERGGTYALNAATGDRLWWQPDAVEFLAATQERLFSRDVLGNILIMNRDTGDITGGMRLTTFTVPISNDRTDRLYLATPSGMVVCIREAGRQFPIYHLFPERLPLLPELVPDDEEAGAAEPSPVSGSDDSAPADDSN